ncbi:PTS lactose/cellobiose transporter subunit IIA [Priestia koreensis]|uniref:PTS lactose/cellobiose transporter subunit IIA n=1 Tax=Priestia koreensis TaxID=284581 RepID=UPI001F575D36|nr:PTS lactose/cellobiose transporter subunit IIA [Priestia koreensis]UNL84704.1 PTS lactose/cellobiose transporter subunit IIA [Priestia koreensis]
MSTFNLENAIFEIISYGGNARSLAHEALTAAEQEDFKKSSNIIEEAKTELNQAHSVQTKLINMELNGEGIEKSLLLVHAQDHLMTAISELSLIERMISMHKKFSTEVKK